MVVYVGGLDEVCFVYVGYVIVFIGLGIWLGLIFFCCCIGEFMGDWDFILCWLELVGGIFVMDFVLGYIDWFCYRNINIFNRYRKGIM